MPERTARLMLDTNVVVDVFERRPQFSEASSAVMDLIEQGAATGLLCATTITTLHYLAKKKMSSAAAIELLGDLVSSYEIAAVNRSVIQAALNAPQADFEDAVLAQAAIASSASAIITRNPKDFVGCGLPVYTPLEWLESELH